jgi:hypothetical protein
LGLRHLASVCAKTATYEGMFDLSQYDDLWLSSNLYFG